MSFLRAVFLFGILLAGFAPAAAQGDIQLRGGIGITSTGYDQTLVDKHNIPGRGWGFQGTFAPRFFRYTTLLVEFGFEILTQVCADECERDRTSTGSIMASVGAGLASPVLYVNDPQGRVGFGLFVNGGREWINAGLSEDGCVNCTIDELDIEGGLWLEPGLDIVAHPTVTIGFAYRIYEDAADVDSRFTIRIIGRTRY